MVKGIVAAKFLRGGFQKPRIGVCLQRIGLCQRSRYGTFAPVKALNPITKNFRIRCIYGAVISDGSRRGVCLLLRELHEGAQASTT